MKNLKRSVLREIQEKYVAGEFDRRDEQRVRRVVWVKNTTGSAIPARSAIQLDGWTSRDVFIGVAPSNPIKTAITLDRIPAGKVGRAKIDLFFANLTNATNATYATAALVGQTTSDGAAFAVVARDGNFAALVRLSGGGGTVAGSPVNVVKTITTSGSTVVTDVRTQTGGVNIPTTTTKTVVTGASLTLSDTATQGAVAVIVGIECEDGVMTPITKYVAISLTTETVNVVSGSTTATFVTSVTPSTATVATVTGRTTVDVVKYES